MAAALPSSSPALPLVSFTIQVFSTIGAAAAADKETYKGPSPEEELIKVCHEIFMYHDDLVVKRKDGKSYVATMEDPLPLTAASAVQAPQ